MSNKNLFKNTAISDEEIIGIKNASGYDELQYEGVTFNIQKKYVRSSQKELSPFEAERNQVHAFSGKKFTAGNGIAILPTKNNGFVLVSPTFKQNVEMAKRIAKRNSQVTGD